MKQIVSEQFALKFKDIAKGLILAVGTPILYYLQDYFLPGWDAEPILKIGASALITYLLKNFFAPTTIVTVSPPKYEVERVKEESAKTL